MNKNFKSGFIGIVGKTNVGKSTLINKIIGEKVSIVSPKSQTTRTKIFGIKTTDKAQFIFVDNPGFHSKAKTRLNKIMIETAKSVFADSDILVIMLDPKNFLCDVSETIIKLAKNYKKPLIFLINKIDLIKKDLLLHFIGRLDKKDLTKTIIPISATTNDGINIFMNELERLLPEGPKYYDNETYTNQTERQLATEIIREKVINLTYDEIPHDTTAMIESFEDVSDKKIKISAIIYVSRKSARGIIIGKGGEMVKKIRLGAERDLKRVLGKRVKLELYVKVKEKWRDKEGFLKELGIVE